MNQNLCKKVEETIRRYDMLKRKDRVLVAVSGGPDSIFLLEALCNLSPKLGIKIFIANLDHAIRGKSSASDSSFVIKKAKGLSLKYIHKKLKMKKSDLSKKLSIEEALRKERYDFFKDAAARLGANIIATGHTSDDQAETVLMRVIKGSTIKGLVGILPVNRYKGIKIIRPLIEIEKKEIINYLNERLISYRFDRTNLQERYFRNAVRKRVLPYLEKYNPRIRRSLALMAESLREDRDFIEEEKKKRASIKKNGKYVSVGLKDLVIQPRSLQREILRDALIRSGAFIKKLNFRHWKDMASLLRYKHKGQSLDLPGGVIMKRTKREILFKKRD